MVSSFHFVVSSFLSLTLQTFLTEDLVLGLSLSVYLIICLLICLIICQFICLIICLLVCLIICLIIWEKCLLGSALQGDWVLEVVGRWLLIHIDHSQHLLKLLLEALVQEAIENWVRAGARHSDEVTCPKKGEEVFIVRDSSPDRGESEVEEGEREPAEEENGDHGDQKFARSFHSQNILHPLAVVVPRGVSFQSFLQFAVNRSIGNSSHQKRKKEL